MKCKCGNPTFPNAKTCDLNPHKGYPNHCLNFYKITKCFIFNCQNKRENDKYWCKTHLNKNNLKSKMGDDLV